jgi:hypothetical protein
MVMCEPEKTKDFEQARQEFLDGNITVDEFEKRAFVD